MSIQLISVLGQTSYHAYNRPYMHIERGARAEESKEIITKIRGNLSKWPVKSSDLQYIERPGEFILKIKMILDKYTP